MNKALALRTHQLRPLLGWTVFTGGALHGLAQALPLLARGF